VVALAKLYDAKPISFSHHCKPRYSTSLSPDHNLPRYPTSTSQNHNPTLGPSSLPGLLAPLKTLTLPTPPTSPSIKTITPIEMQVRRKRGLCYTCDAKFTPSHRCQIFGTYSFTMMMSHPLILRPPLWLVHHALNDVNGLTTLQFQGSV